MNKVETRSSILYFRKNRELTVNLHLGGTVHVCTLNTLHVITKEV